MKLKRYKFVGGDPGKGKGDSSTGFPTPADRVEVDDEAADLVSSELDGPFDEHVLAVDIDLPCHLIETSPGHHHLIIERALPWGAVEDILSTLARHSIVEPGFAAASMKRGKTFLRIHPDTPIEVLQ